MSSKSGALALEECEFAHEAMTEQDEDKFLSFLEMAVNERPHHFSLSTPEGAILKVSGRITVSF